MSCINDTDIIQRYIDGEAAPGEVARIENHLIGCKKCASKIEVQKIMANRVKDTLNLLVEDRVEIPKFELPKHKGKKIYLSRKKIISIVSAACIFFALIITNIEKSELQKEVTIVQDFECDVDANLPISQQELVINIIDSEGNTTEYLIE